MKRILTAAFAILAMVMPVSAQWQKAVQYYSGGTNDHVIVDRDALVMSNRLATAAGDLSGTAAASTVVGLRGKSIPTPGAGDGGKSYVYNAISGAFELQSSGSGSGDVYRGSNNIYSAGTTQFMQKVVLSGTTIPLEIQSTNKWYVLLSGVTNSYANIRRHDTSGGLELYGGDDWNTGGAIWLNGNTFSGQRLGSVQFGLGTAAGAMHEWFNANGEMAMSLDAFSTLLLRNISTGAERVQIRGSDGVVSGSVFYATSYLPVGSNSTDFGSVALPFRMGYVATSATSGTQVVNYRTLTNYAASATNVYTLQRVTTAGNMTSNGMIVVNAAGYTSFVARAIPALSAQLNTIAGDGAGAGLVSGTENTFFGYHAGNAVDASWNVAVGNLAMELASGCFSSTALGAGALQRAAHADRSTAIGIGALNYATWTEYDTAVGGLALSALIHGDYNVAIGEWTMRNLTNGRGNTAIGQATLGNVTRCDFNTALGYNAGYNLTAGEGNIFLGASANGSAVAVSNEFVAGSGTYPTRNVYFGGGPGSAIPWTLHGEFATGTFSNLTVSVNASSGAQAVNYRTMTNYSAGLGVNNFYATGKTNNFDWLLFNNLVGNTASVANAAIATGTVTKTAVADYDIVNYQTMTGYVAGAGSSGFLKADGSVTWLGNQDAGGTVISNLGGFWMGGVLVTNLDTNSVSDLGLALTSVSNRVVTLEGATNGYALKGASNTYSNGTTQAFSLATVSNNAVAGTDAVNYQTMTNHTAGLVTYLVATNIVNSYIAGTGHMLMVEAGSTSVLYHVTSGGHTNKIGEFYTP